MTGGVLLLSFGSAVTAAEVPAYLRSVRGGGEPPPDLVAEFQRRYRLIGRSPLLDITRRQAEALGELLDAERGGGEVAVEVGMLHSPPTVREALGRLLRAGARRAAAVVMAPQFSPIIMAGYVRALDAAARDLGLGAGSLRLAGDWSGEPALLDCLARRVREALAGCGSPRGPVPVIFTAHSLPRAVVDRDPGYLEQVRATAEGVARRAGIERWQLAYQSAGHTPQEWLRPDVTELIPPLLEEGHRDVLVVPTQFLADHLEVLYDIDIAGREEAQAHGMRFRRIEMPNLDPLLIRALAGVALRELAALGEGGERAAARPGAPS